uniref:Complex 1 LYR protein domain-containing protein n=1 Tax=Astyanax mexicanus TaxID=7994 RepID=A0A8B9KIM5_ASTMX
HKATWLQFELIEWVYAEISADLSLLCLVSVLRTYALRRVRDAFRENRSVKDPQALELLLNKARDSLAIIQRQVSVGRMYETQRTVVEPEPK